MERTVEDYREGGLIHSYRITRTYIGMGRPMTVDPTEQAEADVLVDESKAREPLGGE